MIFNALSHRFGNFGLTYVISRYMAFKSKAIVGYACPPISLLGHGDSRNHINLDRDNKRDEIDAGLLNPGSFALSRK